VVTPGPGDYLSHLERLLPHVDFFLPNNHEAQLITGEAEPLRQAERFRSLGAGTVVITLGGDGAVLVNDKVRLRTGVYPMSFVDGSGGGDAFAAGFIGRLFRGVGGERGLRVGRARGGGAGP